MQDQNERLRQDLQNAKKREKRCKHTLATMLTELKEAQKLSEEAHGMLEAYKGNDLLMYVLLFFNNVMSVKL